MNLTNSEENNKWEGRKLAFLIFECTMAVVYLAAGIIFLSTSFYAYMIDGTIRIALGVILSLYGIFRIYRAAKKLL